MHAASYYNYANQWSTGVTNDGWIHDLKYIALREITVGDVYKRQAQTIDDIWVHKLIYIPC